MFDSDLQKSHPRVPDPVTREDFWAFSKAGRDLADLHLYYEDIEPWPDLAVSYSNGFDPEDPASWWVEQMRYPKTTDPKTKKKVNDRSAVIVNSRIAVAGIPPRAHQYMLGSRSAIDWVLNQYLVRTDKTTGITNDPNEWALEQGRPSYIFDLLCSVVTVSMRTLDIVEGLPDLEF